MKIKQIVPLIFWIVIAELAGGIGGFFTAPAIPTWYAGIVKPAWNPPAWVFGPVWTTLYALMGIAAWMVWRKMGRRLREIDRPKGRSNRRIKAALTIFGVQLVLNAIWSILFFGLKSPGWAFAEIIVLWIAIVATIAVFAKLSKAAAWLLVPYILWVSFAGYLNYSIWRLNLGASQPVACTMEAKLCADGSAVGRSGPNCEFAACPEPAFDATWKTFIDENRGISFRYPEVLSTTYMQAYDWPPQVAITDGPFTCFEAGAETDRAGKTELRKVGIHSYCVTKVTEGAAGSIYTQYAYAVAHGADVLIFTETVRSVQCANYDEPYKIECERERETFDFDSVMDRIIQTATVR